MIRVSILVIIPIILFSTIAYCSDSSFAKFDTGGVSVEIPKNWTYLDDNMKGNLNNFSEALAKANNINLNQGNNNIIVAANTFSSYNTPSATVRVSVRPGKFPSQADIKQLLKMSKSEMSEVFDPIVAETKKALLTIDGVKSVKLVNTRIVQSKHLTCIFTELETETSDGIKLSQSYICPASDKNIKLSTSYRKSEKRMFKPILEYIWNSLSTK